MCCLFHTPLGAQIETDVIDRLERQRLFDREAEEEEEVSVVPELYEGELEDIGPQFLVLEKPRREWIRFRGDYTFFHTSNVNYFEDEADNSDLMVFTVELTLEPWETELRGGQLKSAVGYQYQIFRYAVIDGPAELKNGAPVEGNDFQSRMPFAEFTYRKGRYSAAVGMRFTQLFNRLSSQEFYQEYTPYWRIESAWAVFEQDSISLRYEGNYRFTQTDSQQIFPDSWNDKMGHSVSVVYSRPLSERWFLQWGNVFEYSRFMHRQRERNDYLGFTQLTLHYAIAKQASANLFANYTLRESSEAASADYGVLNLGGGASVNVRF